MSGDFDKLYNDQLLLNIVTVTKGYRPNSNWKVDGSQGD